MHKKTRKLNEETCGRTSQYSEKIYKFSMNKCSMGIET